MFPKVCDTQTRFIKEKYMMEGIVLMHETAHEIRSNKKEVFFLKTDLRMPMTKSNGLSLSNDAHQRIQMFGVIG